MDSDDFDIELAQKAVESLSHVLAARTHKKKYLGREYTLPGQLGSALKIPEITACLNSPMQHRRQKGLETFQALWPTLSADTRNLVAADIGWYQPDALQWDDKRSNRKPHSKE